MKTIAIINQKGGVGKSTTALSLGAGFSMLGHRVLFIDLDAQGNLTHTIGSTESPGVSAMEMLLHTVPTESAIVKTARGDIVQSAPMLTGADAIITETGKEYRLRESLSSLSGQYDYVIVDTPPALGILTINALTACEGCIVPAQADIYSLQGIGQLYGTVETVKKYCNPALRVMGILLTRYNGRAIIGREVAEMIERTAAELNTKLYAARIRECTAIKESQAVRQNIFDYAPKSNAAADYRAFLNELLEEEAEDTN